MRRLSLKSTLFGVDPPFWTVARSAASGLNTGFARHRIPASRVDTGFDAKCRNKKPQVFELAALKVAGWTRLELATSCVTASYSVLWYPRDFY